MMMVMATAVVLALFEKATKAKSAQLQQANNNLSFAFCSQYGIHRATWDNNMLQWCIRLCALLLSIQTEQYPSSADIKC